MPVDETKPLCHTCGTERVATLRKRKDGKSGIWVLSCPNCTAQGKPPDPRQQNLPLKDPPKPADPPAEKVSWLDDYI